MSKQGHWRKLQSPSHKGEDQFGNPVFGRTWVDREEVEKKESEKPQSDSLSEIVEKKLQRYLGDAKRGRSADDLKLWIRWKETGDEKDLEVLMDQFQGIIGNELKRWYGAPVPRSALIATANRNLLLAFERYNPENKNGASLSTYASSYVRKMSDTVYKYQNVGRIPQNRITKIKKFQEAQEILRGEMGREPSLQALSVELGWSMAETERMKSEMRRDLIASKNINEDTLEGSVTSASEESMAIRVVYSELDEIERVVFEHTLGVYGKEELPAGDIAKKLNLSKSKVSRIRNKIDAKFRERGI